MTALGLPASLISTLPGQSYVDETTFALEQGELVRRCEISPAELAEHYLQRIEKLGPPPQDPVGGEGVGEAIPPPTRPSSPRLNWRRVAASTPAVVA